GLSTAASSDRHECSSPDTTRPCLGQRFAVRKSSDGLHEISIASCEPRLADLVSMDSRIDRRQFITRGSAVLTGSAASWLLHEPRILQAQIGSRIGEFRLPLPIPKSLSPLRADATTDYYELTQQEAWRAIIPGIRSRIWGYNGT